MLVCFGGRTVYTCSSVSQIKGFLVIDVILSLIFAVMLAVQPGTPPAVTVETIASGLSNPRGIAVFPDGRLLVTEAGDASNIREAQGRMSVFTDLNGDGDFDDDGEREIVMCCVRGYNTLTQYGTGLDEVGGIGDLVLLDSGRLVYTQDDPLGAYVPDGASRGIAVYSLSPAPEWRRTEIARLRATTNAIVYDPQAQVFYIAESGLNRISRLTDDGTLTPIVEIPILEHRQQPVPAGLALDPQTGDLLVALFSGQQREYYGTVLAYIPDAARILRLNPATGEWRDEITGLTTAVDVAIDEHGNRYVVELTHGWPTATMPREFPLYDPNALPDSGGYPRFSGRVTMFPADGSAPLRLAEGLDAPTNITYHDGALYVSVGQGTTGRPILDPDGALTHITGSIVRITGFLP